MPCTKCEEGKYKWGKTGKCEYASKEACESANSKYNKMQPTPLGKKTYEEYEKELKEFNLSKVERVDLGIVQDMQKVADTLGGIIKQSNSALDAADSRVSKIKAFLKDSKSDLQKDYNLIEKNTVALEKELAKANKLEGEAEKASNDLGIKETELPGYNDMLKETSLADDAIGDGDELLNDIDKILTNL
tara:strand:+ start:7175 stop:7741 length:567 start_codon:yes stop_codon:yes gene_type:complete